MNAFYRFYINYGGPIYAYLLVSLFAYIKAKKIVI